MATPISSPNEELIARLVNRLSVEPSTALNPNCLSKQRLYKVLQSLESADFKLPDCSFIKTINRLQQLGLLSPIAVEYDRDKPSRQTSFYRFSLAKNPASHPSHLEILQAYDANGVICYFTAIAFHSLSTQIPSHHHIAIPTKNTTDNRKSGKRCSAPSLGTKLFSYEGIPYYKTSREERLLPGVQLRYIGPEAVIRITDLEQTLLDTLHRPFNCGGPSVVFEAWDQGLKKMHEDRLAGYLASMGSLPIAQRFGYIISELGYTLRPESKLAATLRKYRAQLDNSIKDALDTYERNEKEKRKQETQNKYNEEDEYRETISVKTQFYQQLFPGIKYSNLNTSWLVFGP